MNDVVVRLGQALMLIGMLMAIGSVVAVFARAVRNSIAAAFLVLIVPGYLAFYAWRSSTRMPVAILVWALGILLLVVGAVVVGVFL